MIKYRVLKEIKGFPFEVGDVVQGNHDKGLKEIVVNGYPHPEENFSKVEQTKAEKVEALVLGMLSDCVDRMKKDVKKIISSSAVRHDDWDEDNDPMLLPKSILIAVLEGNAEQYLCKLSPYSIIIRKDANKIKNHL